MSWRTVAASVIGSSHIVNEMPCQDRCWAQVDILWDGSSLLSLFVADGAGSAMKGGEGASLAIEAAADFLSGNLKQGEFCLTDNFATDLVVAVRDRIYAEAEINFLTPRDFACTFLGVLSSPSGTLAFQIGDGGIVIDTGSCLEIAIIPMGGEYANMTHFVTDAEAIRILKIKTYPDPALRIAVFSDGIQRLALNMVTNMPHEPFFAPFFNSMARVTPEQETQLQPLLVKFLESEKVNERTDDDKTLILAIQV